MPVVRQKQAHQSTSAARQSGVDGSATDDGRLQHVVARADRGETCNHEKGRGGSGGSLVFGSDCFEVHIDIIVGKGGNWWISGLPPSPAKSAVV